MIPRAGSAYTYGYVALGEVIGWFIGWDLLLEYIAIVAVVAIGISGYFDAFLTGEPKENVMADAREAGIHFIGAGHYATETFGVRRLGELLATEFGIQHIWVDLPNPV